MQKWMLTPLIGALLIAGCGDEEEGNNADPNTREVSLAFEGVVGDEPFACGTTYNLGTAATAVQFSEFKLFVSNVVFTDAAGEQVALELSDDGAFQEGTVALLDFEDGTATCANGTPETNTTVVGSIPADFEPVNVSFEVGVPFESNHQDQATAPDPLSLAQMFWNWQAGYKFVRVDGSADGGGFRVHLGSTGCMLADGSTTDVTMCMNENRITVVRDNIDLDSTVFTVDAGELLEDLDLTPNEEGNSINCQSKASETDCEAVFPKFGLAFGGSDAPSQTFIQVKQ